MKNIVASVRQRIRNLCERSGQGFQELVQYFAMNRFLCRLAASKYSDRFILKGALLMHALNIRSARSTLDIDLLGKIDNSPDVLKNVISETIDVEVEADGLVFEKSSITVSTITKDADYDGRRIRFRGKLGAMKIPMQIDVGFGDALYPPPIKVKLPSLLGFDTPDLLAYSPETSIAEKAQAIVYLGQLNSRMKDFYDIALFTRAVQLNEATLVEAIARTFKNRKTVIKTNSVVFTDEFYDDESKQREWAAFIRKRNIEDAPKYFSSVAKEVMSYLKPLFEKAKSV